MAEQGAHPLSTLEINDVLVNTTSSKKQAILDCIKGSLNNLPYEDFYAPMADKIRELLEERFKWDDGWWQVTVGHEYIIATPIEFTDYLCVKIGPIIHVTVSRTP